MRTTISNLNGEQQNILHHLSKRLKRTVQPIMIICYGHRSLTSFRTSVFGNTGIEKTNTAVFDILIVVSDDEVLPDSSLMEIARRNSMDNPPERLIILRMRDVLLNLEQRNRFFAAIFRKGIMLHANKDAIKMLPNPLPASNSIDISENQRLAIFLKYAKECLNKAECDLNSVNNDPFMLMLLLNASAVYAGRYFIGAHCGIELKGDYKKIIDFSATLNTALTELFPRNTREEQLLFYVINLTFIDEGFFPGQAIIEILCKRISSMITVCQSLSQKRIAELHSN